MLLPLSSITLIDGVRSHRALSITMSSRHDSIIISFLFGVKKIKLVVDLTPVDGDDDLVVRESWFVWCDMIEVMSPEA